MRYDTRKALMEIESLKSGESTSFSAVGDLRFEGRDGSVTATLLLAVSGESYRLQIVKDGGGSQLAVAGGAGYVVYVDPATGVREEFFGAESDTVSIYGFTIHRALLATLVTGVPPQLLGIVSARILKSGERTITSSSPPVELVYSDRLTEISYKGDSGRTDIVFDPIVAGGGNVSSVTASGTGGSAKITWLTVNENNSFPKGFFRFEESEF